MPKHISVAKGHEFTRKVIIWSQDIYQNSEATLEEKRNLLAISPSWRRSAAIDCLMAELLRCIDWLCVFFKYASTYWIAYKDPLVQEVDGLTAAWLTAWASFICLFVLLLLFFFFLFFGCSLSRPIVGWINFKVGEAVRVSWSDWVALKFLFLEKELFFFSLASFLLIAFFIDFI